MNWLGFFIPSWRFFDRFGYALKLEIHLVKKQDTISIDRPKIHSTRFLLNSEGNYYLFKLSCLQRFIEILQKHDQITVKQIKSLPSYQFLKLVIQNEILKKYQIFIRTDEEYELYYQSEVFDWKI